MGFRYRKSIKIAPGVKINVGKNSVGMSIGNKYGGISVNSKNGTTARASIPGTGISYTEKISSASKNPKEKNIKIENNPNAFAANNTINIKTYGKPVNKIVYCIFAILLGWIGVHKFYAGKVGMGILYLLFCWSGVPAVVAFIEFIIGLCKKSDENGNIWF